MRKNEDLLFFPPGRGKFMRINVKKVRKKEKKLGYPQNRAPVNRRRARSTTGRNPRGSTKRPLSRQHPPPPQQQNKQRDSSSSEANAPSPLVRRRLQLLRVGCLLLCRGGSWFSLSLDSRESGTTAAAANCQRLSCCCR